MKINIATSSGKAMTMLSAFDAALVDAGIANMNLLCLSSVIAASIGQVIEKNDRFGLFVEHDGSTVGEVKNLITDALKGMMKSRDEYEFSEIQFAFSETANMDGESSCVILVATYEADGWEDQKNA